MQPRGVAFALDGFGGGMTAFRHLKDFFFDMVKIDKTFVKRVADDPDNQVLLEVLVEALVTAANQFEMFAIVEGVENARDAKGFRGSALIVCRAIIKVRRSSKLPNSCRCP
jgi:EAL domain-containing protein (putative c-di-GMP-specific phosphodiesterase class I)